LASTTFDDNFETISAGDGSNVGVDVGLRSVGEGDDIIKVSLILYIILFNN